MQSVRIPHFKPSVSGFHFSNSFAPGIPDLTIALPSPFNQTIPIGDASNGVCGGMAYAVADFFLAQPRLHIPTTATTPGMGAPLTNYILRRLLDSFSLFSIPSNVMRYVGLMSTIDHDTDIAHGVPWIIANEEWPKIKADLDAGRPSPIGLVGGGWVWPTNLSAKVKMLGECHQVLAYGYDLDDANNLAILVYDCNDPDNDDSRILLNIGNPTHTTPISTPDITASIQGNIRFRAFFRHDFYSQITPDAGLSPGAFSLSTSLSPGGAVRVGTPVTLKVDARDVGTGAAVSGAPVLVNGRQVGLTGAQFTTTFSATYIRSPTVDPRTHEKSWHWVGPNYPLIQVAAPNYDTVAVKAAFTGAAPPPSPPDL